MLRPELRRRLPVIALQCLGALAFATYRMFEAASQPPAVWQDSDAYLAASKYGIFSHNLWTPSVQAPLASVMLKFAGGFDPYIIMQALISVAAWGFLAWTASRLVRPGWREVAMAWAVLAFATAPLVIQWDWSVLSESPALSALAVLSALGLWMLRRFTWIRFGFLVAAAAIYVSVRDSDIFTVVGVGVVLLIAALVQTLRGAALTPGGLVPALRRRWTHSRRLALVGAVLVAVSGIAGIGAEISHRDAVNVQHVLIIRIFPYPSRVAWFAQHGMPQATAIDELAKQTPATAGTAPIVVPNLDSSQWHQLLTWENSRGMATYVTFLITHPGYVITAPFDSPPLTYNNALGQLSFYEPVGHQPVAALETIFVPGHGIVLIEAGVALLVAAIRRVWVRQEWRFLAAFAFVGVLSMLVAWHGDAEEVTRHMVEGDVEARLGVLLCLLMAVLSDGSRAHVRARPASGPEARFPEPDRSPVSSPSAPEEFPPIPSPTG